jgi:adenine phosphoribosyltransferase
MTQAAREAVLSTFRWVDGHADIWRLFRDAEVFSVVVEALGSVVRQASATKVAGIESRGFILGGAVAAMTGLGFVPIRKEAGLFPGGKLTVRAKPDYHGQEHLFRLQRDAVVGSDRVVLVDDWAEIGSQAVAARHLVEAGGAAWAGLVLVVDQLSPETRAALEPVHNIVTAHELGASED